MKIFLKLLFVSIFMLSTVSVQAQEKIRLKYDFKAGRKLAYEVLINGDVDIEVKPSDGGQIPKNSARLQGKFSYTHEVTSVNDDGVLANINVIYGQSYMNTIVNNQVIPNTDVTYLKGKIARVTVTSDGKIKDFELPVGLPASLQNADFKKMFLIFPNRNLRVGESWIENSESVNDDNENFSITNTLNSTHTLLGIEKKYGHECAKVKVLASTSTITISKSAQIKLDGKALGKVEGIIYFELDSGYIVYSDLNTIINNVVVTQPAQDEKNQKDKASKITTILDTNLKTVTKLL
ncbi:MAG: hypothetical protein KAS13_08415 [Candidatus Omnitrophica bacterium]|nr:hypothetical protein [Candidatus Omnitrophota bacterium]